MSRPSFAGNLNERRESFLQLAHRVPAPLQAGQVREPADMFGEHRLYRAGLRVRHGHRQELPYELGLAAEAQEVLDAALASVELDLGGEQLGVDLLLGELALPSDCLTKL